MIRALGGAIASAALLGLAARAEAPFHWAALIAFAPWLSSIDRRPPREVLLSAWLLTIGFVVLAFGWFPATIASYTGASLWKAWLLALIIAPLLQPQILLAALARRLGITCFVLVYAGSEWLLPKLFNDTLGYAFHSSPALRQLADLGGPRVLTLLALTTSAYLASRALRPVIAAAGLIGAALVYGQWRLHSPAAPIAFKAGMVQAAITNYDKLRAEKGAFETVREILDAHFSLSRTLLSRGHLDLLIWPETVYPTTFGAPKSEDGAAFDREIAAMVAGTKVPLIFGAFEESGAGEHNAIFFLNDGQYETYRKTLLFPLTEHVPGWLDSPRLRSVFPWLGHWQPGAGPRVISLPKLKIAPLICYEVTDFSYVRRAARRADLIVTLSNDSWFPDARAPRLHAIMAAFRSIESRLPQLRAANSGISALILPSGELIDATDFGARAAVEVAVPRAQGRVTPAMLLGDWTGPMSLLLAALLYLPSLARYKRY